jgi:propanol-preferring alcohol dehydrogenase
VFARADTHVCPYISSSTVYLKGTKMDNPKSMRAMVLDAPGKPLRLTELPIPQPGPGQVLLKVLACGVCHTDLHIQDGELSEPKLPLVLGHQIVGTVVQGGTGTQRFQVDERVGVPWLGATDGTCRYCARGQENLCEHPIFTGYTIAGGFAEYTVADERFCFSLPSTYSDVEVAPLLCAGLIGYRTYRMAGENVDSLGIYGFGAAAHIITQVAKHEGKIVYAFTRPGDTAAQEFALRQGADWAGDSTQAPPEKLDAALIFAPVGPLVVAALKATHKGGVVVCGGIHMSDIPSFPYNLLWEERVLRSVANLTRKDGEEFLALAPQVPVKTDVTAFPLEQTGEALEQLRDGKLVGAAVVKLNLM